MKGLYTFTGFTQWNNECIQVLADSELQAREFIISGERFELRSFFIVSTDQPNGIVFEYEIENPNYEG